MPYRIYETLGREEMKKIDRGITMINHTQAEAMGKLSNVLCQVGVTTIIAKFLILDIPIDHDAPIVVGRGFLYTMGSILNTPERLFSTFDGVCHQTFRAARFDVLRTAESDSDDEEEYTQGTHDNEARSSRSKLPRQHKTVEELLLLQVHHEFLLWEVYSREAKSRYNTKLAQLLPRHIYLPCVVNWDVLNRMGCDGEIDDMLRNRLLEDGSDEEIFTSVAWIRAFNINEPIYAELFNEFYSTYGFDEVCADMELHRKISSLDWFISKLARKCRVLTKDVVRSLSALIYCRDLDTITLKYDSTLRDGDTPKMYRADGGAYNPPGYAQPQYDQYYQQYQPPPPQYQQQQDDDE
ncbi:hypothetical protein Tco_0677712 [Tanacetum coccineum]|uniref:Uncharacterized protein n=1 Tax=Tanacetum coccineum TaxID=301880 RepID=A0ABQ4XD09_9ASTR